MAICKRFFKHACSTKTFKIEFCPGNGLEHSSDQSHTNDAVSFFFSFRTRGCNCLWNHYHDVSMGVKLRDLNFPKVESRFQFTIKSDKTINIWNIAQIKNPCGCQIATSLEVHVISCLDWERSTSRAPILGRSRVDEKCPENKPDWLTRMLLLLLYSLVALLEALFV